MADDGGNIKVVVRCRPLNSRELARGAKGLIRMQGNQTFIDPPDVSASTEKNQGRGSERKTLAFAFDKSYWSAGDRDDPDYCSQQTLYDDLGKELLDHGFAGFNACILAYGQTGSGKSYSMMGYGADKGIIPLTCSELFTRTEDRMAADPNISFTVEVSYIEIYNEKVRDLLNPKNKGNLKVREHPSMGPYVEDLSKLMVGSYEEMMTLMDEGNKARTVAATNMNETSSRSHAVFTLLLTQKRRDVATNLDTEKVSRISLVDLAGSERANSTGATGQRLKEGANINKSLTTLGKVISALAMASEVKGKGKKGKAEDFVPYRDSVLTWLLKDSLGGNSKTAMIAAISPADYDETLSTLRYADQAKKIKNKAVVNEDPNAKLIRELKEELETLRMRVSGGGGGHTGEDTYDPAVPPELQKVTYRTKEGEIKTVTKAALQEQLQTSEKLMRDLNETWEEKMLRTQEVQKEREKALEELGITVEKNLVGVHTPKKMPHLVNLNEDPLMSECLIYQLKNGRTMVGRLDSEKPAAIRLSGESILEEHCYFENTDGKVFLYAMPESTTFLNGKQIDTSQPYKLKSGYRIILGEHHVFRFNNPEEVRKQRDRQKSNMHISVSASDLNGDLTGSPSTGGTRPDSPVSDSSAPDVDWTYAKREAALARLGMDPGLDNLPDEDLNKLYERITKVKTMRDHGKSRPESSLSHTNDVWSEFGRPFEDAFTDDTSIDNAAIQENPELEDSVREMQEQMEAQRADFESRLSALSESSEAEDLRVEKTHMEHQLKLLQTRMKKVMGLHIRRSEDELEDLDPIVYTAKQLRLIRKVLDKWRAHRAFSMAELTLSSAVLLKEANIISEELHKDVTYNFTIASGGSLAAPTSQIDAIAGLDEIGDVVDPTLASATQPTVAVKVLDKRHNAVYVWSLDRMQQQVQRMRNLTSFIDRPSYSQHFSSEEPFYDSPPPRYSFIGNALVSLASLSRRLSSTSTVPIFCRYTAEAIGSCRVDIKIINLVESSKRANGSNISTRSSSPMPRTVPSGSRLGFFVTIDSVKGLSPHEFSSVHCQVRLSAFMGSSTANEEIYPSSVVDIDQQSLSDLKFRHSFNLAVTSRVSSYLRDGYAPIEFFASAKPTYVERLERWDELREQKGLKIGNIVDPTEAQDRPPALPLMRRSETDFVVEQTHDVIARLQICELGSDGQYTPVPAISQGPLDPGAFILHQGIQRRLVLTLESNSGRQLPWTSLARLRIGFIRSLDPKGLIQESPSKGLVDLALTKEQNIEFNPDGTASISTEAAWDSGVHNSALLNKVTLPQYRVLLQLQWFVLIESCTEPVHFSMDVAITMKSREAGTPSKVRMFFDSSKVVPKTTAVFSLRMTPPLTRSPKELWRLDTSEKYVRGEEVLSSWKPRGVSVVQDYSRLISTERRAADVQAVKAVLSSLPSITVVSDDNPWKKEKDQQLLEKCLALWQRRSGYPGEILLNQEPDESDGDEKRKAKRRNLAEPLRLVGQAKLMPRVNGTTKYAYLTLLTDAAENTWEKRWVVLRRPYVHIYLRSDEVDEVNIISLSGVKVEHNPDMEELFKRKYVFTLFTSTNSLAFAAPSAKELQSWITKLDPTRLLS
ncbi:kinesin-domain-containing protein [Sistotremastrum niveocremeum HHB9708]|uniref:Kinesin-domain-containing protein n=1 Tax=Sistotremastrum niveocremeum HHB9708 TaxID=1314777 RepID=A0A164TTK1_9AGAM|nr:kinesin-domain-containing protein [Sistotremastrum niveocremeum HHB9708]